MIDRIKRLQEEVLILSNTLSKEANFYREQGLVETAILHEERRDGVDGVLDLIDEMVKELDKKN
jgi:hypothetical protein